MSNVTLNQGIGNFWSSIADPMFDDLFPNDPFWVLMTIGLYLSIVKFGPQVMANRKPMTLVSTMKIYNLINVFGCAFICAVYFSINQFWSTILECKIPNRQEDHLKLRLIFGTYLFLKVSNFC